MKKEEKRKEKKKKKKRKRKEKRKRKKKEKKEWSSRAQKPRLIYRIEGRLLLWRIPEFE